MQQEWYNVIQETTHWNILQQQQQNPCEFAHSSPLNPLTPNDHYRGHTAPLTSKFAFYIFIQQI